jgi:signal transduction histidine kinase
MMARPCAPRVNPLACDAGLAVLSAVALLVCAATHTEQGGHVDAAAVVIALMACSPVAFRRFAPLPALVAVVAGAFVSLATFKPMGTVLIPVDLVLYTVAVTGTRRRTLGVAVLVAGSAVLAVVAHTDHGPLSFEALQKDGMVLLPLLLGEAIREHRAFKQAMVERAERAERTREEEARRRVGEERLRIAREIHDAVAHAMVAINVQSGVAAHLLDRTPESAREALLQIKRVSGEALTDLRTTLGVLRDEAVPAPTAPAPSLRGLDDLAEHLHAAGVAVEIERRGGADPLPAAIDATGYRIVQEALTNVMRHSGAQHAGVRIDVAADAVEIEIVDDGIGSGAGINAFPPPNGNGDGNGGNGLRGMRERVAAIGGDVDAGPAPDGGWRVRARLPLPVAAA